MDWFLKQPENAVVNGYTNHFWNGLTTLHFGRVISGIINSNNFLKGTFHLIPKDICSKYELLQLFARHFGRPDLTVQAHTSLVSINRTLDTVFSEKNLRFWKDAGYNFPLSIAEMLSEYADWESDKIWVSRQK
jgi:dTDP-4-dehydrorhamnose reductase